MKNNVLIFMCLVCVFAISVYGIELGTSYEMSPEDYTLDGEDIVILDGGFLILSGTHSFNSLHVMAGGTVTHDLYATSDDKIDLTIVGDLIIDSDGQINVDYKGYINEQGPGAGTGVRGDSNGGGGGGAYGGNGGMPQSIYSGGTAYGSIIEPADYGSGGGDGYGGVGGKGGGKIRITVGGTLTNNGIISSNGANGPSHSYGAAGGGSGGSIWIGTGTLAGTGIIRANGGNGAEVSEEDGGGGSGGRIAIYASTNTYSGAALAIGGNSTVGRCGGAGTVYFKDSSSANGIVFIGNDMRVGAFTPLASPVPFDISIFDSATAALGSEIIEISNLHISNDASIRNLNGELEGSLFANGNVEIVDAGYIWANIGLIVQEDLIVDCNSIIKADFKGYHNEEGPGAGTGVRSDSNGGGGGGAYGGNGGMPQSIYSGGIGYGSVLEPDELGSGGGDGYAGNGGSGGGKLRITVGGTITNNGIISSNGANGPSHSYGAAGGGSGGSIWIDTGYLDGTGIIRANGGNGADVYEEDGGGGGGGRIAVYFEDSTFAGSMQAFGGLSNSVRMGGAGTIYTKKSTEALGLVYVDNNSNTNTRTPINAESVFDLVVANGAMLAIEDLVTVGNLTIEFGGLVVNPSSGNDIELLVQNDMLVEAGGLLWANPTLTILGNLTVEEDGVIKADSKGYLNEEGPGAGTGVRSDSNGGGGGGAYGGNGGKPQSIYSGGIGYGSILEPDDLGSGGGDGYAGNGGSGGGKMRIMVDGALTNNGIISSDGANGPSHSYGAAGGGSGGSIWIDTGYLDGAGIIRANGGNGADIYEEDGGGGGGGRIAVYFEDSTFAGSMQAFGGLSSVGRIGGAGTICTKLEADEFALVTVNNNDLAEGLTHFDTVAVFDLLVSGGGKVSPLVPLTSGTVTVAQGGLITNPIYTNDIEMTVFNDLIVQDGGHIWASSSIDVGGDVIIDGGGIISANGKGYGSHQGPGAGTGAISESAGGGGGAYGGYGGKPESGYWGGSPYGSEFCPMDYGSGGGDGYAGGGGAGGGIVKLQVGGSIFNNGLISSNGNNGASHSYGAAGGGAGGSLWLIADSLSGGGFITAYGGIGPVVYEQDGGGGSGGRIAIYHNSGMNILLDNISAAGGAGYRSGDVGTIYVLDANDSLFISDDSTPTDVVDYYVGFVDISFTSPINESTFTASDVVLTAPSGTIIGISNIVKLDTITGRNVYRIEFAQQRAEGQYSLRIGPNITSESGNLLDQDHNGVGGETADVYIHGFTIDYLSEPDLMVFLEAWLTNDAPEYDFVDDNIINIQDFAVFSSHWLGIDR